DRYASGIRFERNGGAAFDNSRRTADDVDPIEQRSNTCSIELAAEGDPRIGAHNRLQASDDGVFGHVAHRTVKLESDGRGSRHQRYRTRELVHALDWIEAADIRHGKGRTGAAYRRGPWSEARTEAIQRDFCRRRSVGNQHIARPLAEDDEVIDQIEHLVL